MKSWCSLKLNVNGRRPISRREKGSPKGLLRLYSCRDYGMENLCSNVLSNFFRGNKSDEDDDDDDDKDKRSRRLLWQKCLKDIGTKRERTLKLSSVDVVTVTLKMRPGGSRRFPTTLPPFPMKMQKGKQFVF